MKVLVMKSNSDYWYEVRSFNSIEDIYNLIEEYHCGIIVEKNFFTEDDTFDFWDGMKAEDIPVIEACPLQIMLAMDAIDYEE